MTTHPPPCCPTCRQILTRVGQFWICPEHGEVPLEKPVTPLRIFLSYGHDANEELVRIIKADLEKRGHDVWFDKNEIKFGHDWRRSITEGITNSHKFVSFLSKHSARDPGVCLDEIGIAIGVKEGNIQTILVESEQQVKPPPGISATQWLDMHDWKERRAAGEAAWETWYQEQLAEIIRVVESEESQRFAGEIETLKNHLKPIRSDSRIYELLKKGLTGRQWLFEAVEKWRSGDRASRVFWLMGAPGVGKSAVAAHLAIHGREVIAVEFCNWQQPGHKNPEQIVRTLAFQIATRLPDYRTLLLPLPDIAALDRKNAAELFDYLLAAPLHHAIDGGRERYLIVIDALDEAGEAGRNPLVEMLARYAPRLPEWIGVVVTSRPESNVIAPLQGLNPFPFETSSEKNRADIRDYLRHELASPLLGRADADRLIGQILEKSEGVFLYVERFCDDIRCGHLSLDRPEQFPQGLGGLFFQWFQRQFPDLEKFRKDVRPALRAILAAREPLPVEILQRLFNWQEEELGDFTRTLGSLFPVTTEASTRMANYDSAFPHLRSIEYATPRTAPKVIKACHKSLVDWLTNDEQSGCYFVSSKEGHRCLAELGCREIDQIPRAMSPYLICNLPQHLAAIGDLARLREVLNEQWFWQHSPVFYRDEFYVCLTQFMSPEDLLAVLAPAMSYFAKRAAARSPAALGYTLFPHEPGVTFGGGTPVYAATDTGSALEYTIPRGATEPPWEVLYDFVKCCHSTFLAASAFLRGVPNRAIAEWYRDYWKRSGLQATLDDIERYYDSCAFSLAHRAMDLSCQIDAVAKKVISTQPAGEGQLSNSTSEGKA